jgi:nucleoside phosphorylase
MGSSKTSETAGPPIAVFTALAWESAAVRSILRQVKKVEERVWQGSTGKRAVLVITGGIGLRRTRQTVERFAATPLSAVLSVGCAGALIPGLTTGQLILAPDIRMQPAKDEEQLKRFPVDTRLLAEMRTAAARAGAPVADGPLFTSPTILFTSEEKATQGERTGAIAVEMESGVHAEFAEKRGLPFLVLRVILDGVDMTIPAVAGLTTPEGEVRYMRAATYLATHPHHFSALLAIKRAREAAARSIARLCQAFFSQLSV